MSTESKAVFLSYASQDAEAARRICDALRASGVEVWFDQSELRGGDAWDAKIRKQIRECALFVPVISANTQARGEGYFRREWKLAVERTHDMGDHIPFLLPVTIDGTTEKAAFVPEAFLKVQWSKVPAGEVKEPFVEQVRRLLAADPVAAVADRGLHPSRPRSATAATVEASKRRRFPVEISVLAVVLVATGLGFWYMQRNASGRKSPSAISDLPSPTNGPSSPAAQAAAALPPIPTDKSIAVLPFANMSVDQENSAVMANGIHDDILINLSLIREFRIPTSVEQYRGTNKPSGQIARELQVAYIMKASVVRDGSKVRVTGQLVNARTDELVWSNAYEGDMVGGGLFALQAGMAKEIAAALKTALSPEERSLVERRPTESSAAYELYVRSRDLENREGDTRARRTRQVDFLKEAVAIDPKFADAWANLASCEAYFYFLFWDHTEARLAAAKNEIETALRLQPGSPEVIRGLAYYHYCGSKDYERAAEESRRLIALRPNSPEGYGALAGVLRRQGLWLEAIKNQRSEVTFNPTAPTYMYNLAETLSWGRRHDETIAARRAVYERSVAAGDSADSANILLAEFRLATARFSANGRLQEVESFLAGLSPAQANSPTGLGLRLEWAQSSGDFPQAVALDRQLQLSAGTNDSALGQAIRAADVLFAIGDPSEARTRLGTLPAELRVRLQREFENAALWSILGRMEALLGNKEAALSAARHAVELLPESSDANSAPQLGYNLALVYARTGDKDRAIEEIKRLLQVVHGTPGVHFMRNAAATFPLHGDPRFEALLNDPKNNAPLF